MARTPSRRKTDEHAFPVRVRFRDREPGPDWIRWSAAETWLVENVGKGHFAKHGDGGRYDLYFRTGEAAHRFMLAFPHFRLFDMTEQVDYLRAAQGHDALDAVGRSETHHGKVVHPVQPAMLNRGF
jgi:hypothetical protein